MAARYAWNEAKRQQNQITHRVDFEVVERFEWDLAQVDIDYRENYGELREKATSFIGDVLHVLVFTMRRDELGDVVWVISLRKANARERVRYVEGA